jgi:hypothetical protein
VGHRQRRASSHGLQRLCFEDDEVYQIRLVGKPFRVLRHYIPIVAISPGYEDDACWQAGFQPRERYAALVFDRLDGNRLKYIEEGTQLFRRLARSAILSKTPDGDPGGEAAPDWLVRADYPQVMRNGHLVKGHGPLHFTVEPLGKTKLTAEEKRRISDNPTSFGEILVPTSPEEIARLFETVKHLEPGDPVPGSPGWS